METWGSQSAKCVLWKHCYFVQLDWTQSSRVQYGHVVCHWKLCEIFWKCCFSPFSIVHFSDTRCYVRSDLVVHNGTRGRGLIWEDSTIGGMWRVKGRWYEEHERMKYTCRAGYNGGGEVTCLGKKGWSSPPICTGTWNIKDIFIRSLTKLNPEILEKRFVCFQFQKRKRQIGKVHLRFCLLHWRLASRSAVISTVVGKLTNSSNLELNVASFCCSQQDVDVHFTLFETHHNQQCFHLTARRKEEDKETEEQQSQLLRLLLHTRPKGNSTSRTQPLQYYFMHCKRTSSTQQLNHLPHLCTVLQCNELETRGPVMPLVYYSRKSLANFPSPHPSSQEPPPYPNAPLLQNGPVFSDVYDICCAIESSVFEHIRTLVKQFSVPSHSASCLCFCLPARSLTCPIQENKPWARDLLLVFMKVHDCTNVITATTRAHPLYALTRRSVWFAAQQNITLADHQWPQCRFTSKYPSPELFQRALRTLLRMCLSLFVEI